MKLLIVNAHSDNRGDEAAVKAMVDELLAIYPTAEITLSRQGSRDYPCMPARVKQIQRFPRNQSRIDQLSFFISVITKGRLSLTKDGREFLNAVKTADLVLHAPGGPSIGDIYGQVEWLYLWRLNLIRRMGVPYMFYAPSMGPFKSGRHEKLRKKVISGAEKVILRDPISIGYVKKLLPEIKVEHAMDSALQHDIVETRVKETFDHYDDLQRFLSGHKKVIGVTITDLKWHPVHGKNSIIEKIPEVFRAFIQNRIQQDYGIIFIPQLFGVQNDIALMREYMCEKDTFLVDSEKEEYDAYFQQYLIGKLYAVIGMRYHSNIFSAKMGTPFISISYEQKMKGFMQSIGFENYCIDLKDLSLEQLEQKFTIVTENYESISSKLQELHPFMKEKAYHSTIVVKELLER